MLPASRGRRWDPEGVGDDRSGGEQYRAIGQRRQVEVALAGSAHVVTQGLVGRLHEVLGLGPLRVGSIQHALPLILAVHFTYAGYVRVMERRSVAELSGGGALRESGVGAVVGFTLLAGSVAAIAALGYYHVDAVNPWTTLIPPWCPSSSWSGRTGRAMSCGPSGVAPRRRKRGPASRTGRAAACSWTISR